MSLRRGRQFATLATVLVGAVGALGFIAALIAAVRISRHGTVNLAVRAGLLLFAGGTSGLVLAPDGAGPDSVLGVAVAATVTVAAGRLWASRDRAQDEVAGLRREQARTAERMRIARDIHDSPYSPQEAPSVRAGRNGGCASQDIYATLCSMNTRTVKRAYRFRFYPTPQQEQELLRTWGCVRVVYNRGLAMRTRSWEQDQRRVSYAETDKALTGWKKEPEFGFLTEVSSVPLQQCLRHLQTAFVNFFEKRAKYPRFKSRKRSRLSLTYSERGFRFRDGALHLAKMAEPLDVHYSRRFDATTASSVTVTRDAAGRWFVSILCEDEVTGLPVTGKTVGVDLGVKDAVVLSDGRKLNPSDSFELKRKQAKVKKCQRRLAKTAKGSRNRVKARHKLSRATAALADATRDWLHQVTTALVREFDVICIEDLNVRGMTASARGTVACPGKNVRAKAGLNRGILAHNFGEFRCLLEYKAGWYGREVIAVDRFFPSSKTCSSCGHVNDQLRLHHRSWVCPDCGACHDRDVNAAININAAGLAVYACGDGVRPVPDPAVMRDPGPAVVGEPGRSHL